MLYPSPHRDVIGAQAPLGEQLLYVTVGKREAQVPADRKQDDLRFKLAPLEQSGNRWDTEHPSILAARLSGQASKVAKLPPRAYQRLQPSAGLEFIESAQGAEDLLTHLLTLTDAVDDLEILIGTGTFDSEKHCRAS